MYLALVKYCFLDRFFSTPAGLTSFIPSLLALAIVSSFLLSWKVLKIILISIFGSLVKVSNYVFPSSSVQSLVIIFVYL